MKGITLCLRLLPYKSRFEISLDNKLKEKRMYSKNRNLDILIKSLYDRFWAKGEEESNEYNEIILNKSHPQDANYLSPDDELSLLIDIIYIKHDFLIKVCKGFYNRFPNEDVSYLLNQIRSRSFSFEPFIGSLEKKSEKSLIYSDMPGKLNYSFIPVEGKFLTLKISDLDNLVQGSLSLFLQERMTKLGIGSGAPFEYKANKLEFYWSNIKKSYISSIVEMKPCRIGCYIHFFPFISQVNRETLFYRLEANISSSEIKDLLRSYLNNKYVLTGHISSFSYRTGLPPVGSLTMTVLDFFFSEMDFYFSKYDYYYSRKDLNVFIGFPYNELDPSPEGDDYDKYHRLDSMMKSIEFALKTSFTRMGLKYAPVYRYFLLEDGQCIPLFDGVITFSSMRFIYSETSPNKEVIKKP